MQKALHLIVMLIGSMFGLAQNWPPPTWTQSTPAFHILGPVYYVGGRELTAFLIVDQDELVLINVGMEENATMVLENIKSLGFSPQKLRYVLITQAHMDHAGGAQKIQEVTGAVVLAGPADAQLMKTGGKGDYVFGDKLPYPAVEKVSIANHRDRIRCGELILETISTPGHTPGSTSWLLKTKESSFLFQASISVLPKAHLTGNKIYPNVVEDYRRSFARLSTITAEYVLPDHFAFAHPEGVSHQDAPQAAWFKKPEILTKQIARSKKALNNLLEKAAH